MSVIGKKSSSKSRTSTNANRNGKPAKGKLIYYFGQTRTDGDGQMKPLLGG